MPDEVQREENVVFGVGGGRELRCYIYRPVTPSLH